MADAGLELDVNNISNQGDTYSSLTDINNINLFTDSFQKQIESVNENEVGKLQDINSQLFMYSDDNDNESEIVSYLFLDNGVRVIKQESENVKEQNYLSFMTGFLVFFTIIAVVIYLMYRKNKFQEKMR